MRWVAIFVALAAVHFAGSAGSHVYVSSSCRVDFFDTDPDRLCQAMNGTAQALELPLVPVLRGSVEGNMGWRRAFVYLAANSAVAGALATGAIALLAGVLRGRRG